MEMKSPFVIPKRTPLKVRRDTDVEWIPYTTKKKLYVDDFDTVKNGAFWLVKTLGWELLVAPSFVIDLRSKTLRLRHPIKTKTKPVQTQESKEKKNIAPPTIMQQPKRKSKRKKRKSRHAKPQSQQFHVESNPILTSLNRQRTLSPRHNHTINNSAPGSGTDHWRESD